MNDLFNSINTLISFIYLKQLKESLTGKSTRNDEFCAFLVNENLPNSGGAFRCSVTPSPAEMRLGAWAELPLINSRQS